MGNRLIYTDSYEQALRELTGQAPARSEPAPASAQAPAPASTELDRLVESIAARLKRYRELMGQGQYVEAAREMEALDRLTRRK